MRLRPKQDALSRSSYGKAGLLHGLQASHTKALVSRTTNQESMVLLADQDDCDDVAAGKFEPVDLVAMSTWMNDAAIPNHNANGFPHMNDPNAAMMDPSAFMANPAQFNAAQFANQQQPPQQQQSQQPQQQQMPGMQNGPMRNASPSFQNPVYQTNSVIPSKRPRPREDSLAGSPRQNPGMLPTSRSQTPQQQSFPGFQPGSMPQQQPPGGQFPHLQPNGSANASPSPIMGNQMRPGNVPQRVATASPHPFSPSAQQFGAQTSPIPSEHGTPQPNPYMQNMAPGYNPNFAPSPSNPRPASNPNAMAGAQMMHQQMGQMQHMGQMPNAMYSQMQQQQQQQQQGQPQQPPVQQQAQSQGQLQQQGQPGQPQPQRPQNMSDQQKMAAYQMRLQQQLQGNMQMQAQMQAQNMGRGMMPKQQMHAMPNGQMPQGAMRPQQRPMANLNPEQFMKNLAALMSSKGQALDPNPMVADRPVNLVILFQAVQGKGGYKPVTAANGWAHISQVLGLPAQIPSVGPALKQVYERNLLEFEKAWKQRLMMQNMAANQQGTPQKQMPPGQQMNQGQMTPNQQPPSQPQSQPQPQPQNAMKPLQPPVNGLPTPQPPQQANSMPGHNKAPSMSQPGPQPGPNDFSMPSPVPSKPGSMSMPQPDGRPSGPLSGVSIEQRMPPMAPKSEAYSPCSRELSTYGGVDLNAANMLGAELERWRPDVPSLGDFGTIDIQALTRSLQSGIHGEVRLALDMLAAVSSSTNQAHFLQLRYCEDLVDALVDCAEDQLDLLAEHTVEVSDEIQLTPYEDVFRACRLERWAVRAIPTFGSTAYELDRAVDRLICITTILRNVSFPGEQNDNHVILADESIIKFICVIIRYLGTRTMLLRTQQNTLDFMKDIVILLSNIAGSIEIPGREQAFCLLQFLLAFAPAPGPTTSDNKLFFSPYDPSVHPYLPHAVDALAKLLARDEPNRTHYKTVFALDATGTPPYELLTRTFALAVSTIPDRAKDRSRPPTFPSLVDVRKPFLMQGLLSAEILATLVPSHEPALARSWLGSESGIVENLFRLVQELTQLYEQPQLLNRGAARTTTRKDPELVYIVVVAISLLRRLAEKARDQNKSSLETPVNFIPPPQALVDALSMQSPEWTKEGYLQQLAAFFQLST
ncbi:SWI/SNF chromatin-remodeling complex subunit sol1 [Paramyrothecium foliicola]|nr:SWI/SNF chromatin-remodeling complex subunit sol1 [Paramyrothecium foliicola]